MLVFQDVQLLEDDIPGHDHDVAGDHQTGQQHKEDGIAAGEFDLCKAVGGDGDDEEILVDFSKMPDRIEKIAVTVTIYEAKERRQNFGQVNNSYVRVVNSDNEEELLRYDLGEEFSIETAIVVCEIYRHNGEWKFNALGSGFEGGLEALCKNFGVNI